MALNGLVLTTKSPLEKNQNLHLGKFYVFHHRSTFEIIFFDSRLSLCQHKTMLFLVADSVE